MPIYEYQCESCAISFERMQRFEDEPLRTCPECGGKVRRVLQPVGVIFKGSGFYITDHRQVSSATSRPPKQLAEPKGSDETKALPSAEDSTAKPEKVEKKEATD
jgi:putative FmdB family regulatory protein